MLFMRHKLVIWFWLLGISLFAPGALISQHSTGNDWVLQTLQQDYWKFPVVQTGIYRIDSTTLALSGVLTSPGFDPRRLQLFRNGEEVAIYVHGEQDGVFNDGDYIEFFGSGNDAQPDKQLFHDSSFAVNQRYSLFTDTAYYFLTIGSGTNNKRLIIESSVDFGNYGAAAPYFKTKSWFEPAGTYFAGGYLGSDFSKDSRYMDGEGWVDFPFGIDPNMTNPRVVNLQTRGVYQQGPPATLQYTIVGRSRYIYQFPAHPGKNHHVRVSIAGASGHLDDFTYFGYQVMRRSVQIPATSLSTGFSTSFHFAAVDDLSTNPSMEPTRSDRNSIVRAELTFPHGTNLNNATERWMYIPDHPNHTKTYLSLTQLSVPFGEPILYDLTNQRRIVVATTGNTREMLIPNSLPGNPSEKECFLSSEGMIRNITALYPLTTGHRFTDYLTYYQQNSHDYLIITHPSLQQAADAYATYRRNNGYPTLYDPVIENVESLYEQFSYGIRNNPLAIENFLKYLYDHQVLPQTIFIIGKGYSTLHTRRDTNAFRNSLVPGWGHPATDNKYINRLSPVHVQDHSIGRLAATDPGQVLSYLHKVRQYEDSLRLRNEMWMKRAIHLGGGINAGEQTAIRTSLAKWEKKLEAPYFGGQVTTFLKTTTQPIEIIQSQQLMNLINSGIRIMSFYGHGSATGFDISTDAVSTYQNEGRYPLVIANSCYSGDLFNNTFTKSEEFVLTPNKGAIAYLGSSNYSTIDALNLINDTLYHYMSRAGYGKTLGELTRHAMRPLSTSTIFYHVASYQQTTLHGDPAIVLSVQELPDYQISPSQVFFKPSDISNELDSFAVHIISKNPGKAVKDSFAVSIRRTFPDQQLFDTLLHLPSTAFIDTFVVMLPVEKTFGVGLNTIEVTLDALFQIQESDETNNSTSVPLHIKASSLLPIYPYEYAVVADPQVTLYASTIDPFSSHKRYHFELSDNPGFSTVLASSSLQGTGGVFSWTPPITLIDSAVYFWRVSVDSLDHPEGITDWRHSSFRYIPGRTGWAQAHPHQFTKNQYQNIVHHPAAGVFEFISGQREIIAQTGMFPSLHANQHYYSINGNFKYQSSEIIKHSLPGGFIFAVFDTIAAEPIRAINTSSTWSGNWGNYQAPATQLNAFEFPTHSSHWTSRLAAFFDSIPAGHYVLAYSIKDHHAGSLPEAVLQGFESIGSASIRNLPSGSSYIIFGQKGAPIGDPNKVHEVVSTGSSDTTRILRLLDINWYQGTILSTEIGPAKEWGSAFWKQSPLASDPQNTDSVKFSLVPIDRFGNPHHIAALADIKPHPDSIVNLSQILDAEVYPTLRFEAKMRDDVYRTPAQLHSWMVYYTPVGETALDPSSRFTFHHDTIQQGDSLRFSIATRNISNQPMDSLLVHSWIVDSHRQTHKSTYRRYREHPAGDTLFIDHFTLPTATLTPGLATLIIEVNPVNPQTGFYDQPEQTHINNMAKIHFEVTADDQSPLLDVTFDGIRILDGDIISAQPMIEIQLNDENPFFLFNQPEDTALFRVYLRSPHESEFQQLFFRKGGVEQMIFYPASGTNNQCRILFPADFLGRDGTYLFRVEATDKSYGESGSVSYQISFKVISQASITEVLNWPNPFTTKTHFVFTLTGHEVPTDFRIQIMTISGRVIRELTMAELGPINLGRNITMGYWDGTDEFGDRVANGVYLYRVHSSIRDRQIERAASGADPYFREGWGKMYLMR